MNPDPDAEIDLNDFGIEPDQVQAPRLPHNVLQRFSKPSPTRRPHRLPTFSPLVEAILNPLQVGLVVV